MDTKNLSLGRLPFFLAFAMAALIGGCSEAPPTAETDLARPVKSMIVAAPEQGGIRNFPGRIDAVNRAELSFRVPGKVVAIKFNEGDRVKKSQILAQLDATDYRITLKDRQASFDSAKNDFERAKDLVEKGHISRRDFDKLEATFKSASAALEQAQQNLRYTDLRAPFDGVVAKRKVEQFEEVQAKQPVLSLQDSSSLEVKIDVPENIILRITQERVERNESGQIPVWASFDSVPGKRFELSFKEIATKADPKTQTFEATYTMPAPQGLVVLPGMTVSVTVDLSRSLDEKVVYFVPVSAIGGDRKLDPRVWVVDEEAMVVHEKQVELGVMKGANIEVISGLQPGDRVVTVGAAYLAEGMKISLMQETEQAEPRSDDLQLMQQKQ